MSTSGAWPWPVGYEVLRILSEGGGGVVALARKIPGELVALKLLRLAPDANPEEALTRHEKLRLLTVAPGLLHITACGLASDRLWLWEELELADSLDGGPATVGDDYQPATLRAELIERGPFSTEAAVAMGLTLCAAVETLHAHGLVHRDVKPGTLLRVGGKVALGDYGLTAPPGTPFDFKGTEGFVPSEGTADAAADLFALGKTLYELWTGCDRLEFPTIPKPVLESPEWMKNGAALNEFLLRACSPQSSQRFRTAVEFAEGLQAAAIGRMWRASRRRWLAAAAATAGVFACAGILPRLLLRKPVAHWRLRNPWGHLPQSWGANQPILDEQRRCMLQFWCGDDERAIHRIDLESFKVAGLDLDMGKVSGWKAILHPTERTLWFAEDGRGPVWRMNPETGKASLVGGHEPAVTTDFQNTPYWNPVTQRMGCFGGYGQFQVRNWRWEFDVSTGLWIEVEKNDPKREPRCRVAWGLMPLDGDRKLLLFGGHGNSSGKQGERDSGFKIWNQQFHDFGDLWLLDLASSRWECILPAPGLELSNYHACAYLKEQKVVVVIHAHDNATPDGTPPEIFIHRLGKGTAFEKVASQGDVPNVRERQYLTALPGGRSLAAFMNAGIYELTLEV